MTPGKEHKKEKFIGAISKIAYKRNTGLADSDGLPYTNTDDVILLNKLGYTIDENSYLFLPRGEEREGLYTYIEKNAGVPKDVSRCIDEGKAFSAEYLKSMDYSVPKGYEVKGDLCCPVEKTASTLVVSGIHGDEPAGDVAAKKLEEHVDVVSEINPSNKRRFRGKDINRHFDKPSAGKKQKSLLDVIKEKKPNKVISLHEDNEVDKPYAYSSASLKEETKEALKDKDTATSAHGDKTEDGVISEGKNPPDGSLEKALDNRGIDRVTVETPSKSQDIDQRVKTQLDVVKGLLDKTSAATHELKSSNIKAVGYNKEDKSIVVVFHSGGNYNYKDVPKSLFDRIKRVKSPGKFFHKHIKKDNSYKYEKMEKESAYKNIPQHIRDLMIRRSQGDKSALEALRRIGRANAAKRARLKPIKDLINRTSEPVVAPLPVTPPAPIEQPVKLDPAEIRARFDEIRRMLGNSEQTKQAGISDDMMMPHQQRIVDKLKRDDQEGLILMHGLGSGKTRSSIEAYKALGLPAEVIAPAALKENYRKEIKKWVGKHPKDVNIRSQQEVSRKGLGDDDLSGKLMILDEAHRMRNDSSKLYSALSAAHPKKRVLLSGTPIYNHPGDIATLVNIAAGKRLMPEDRKAFEQRYINRREIPASLTYRMMGMRPGEHVSLKNTGELKGIFSKYVDYHAGNNKEFPSLRNETVYVPLAEQQKEIYDSLMKKIPWLLRKKIEMGLAPNKRELDRLVPFLTGARMISNSTNDFVEDPATAVSPKINKAFSYLQEQMAKDKNYKALIYSNYLKSGVEPYKKLLNEAHIPYGEFTGEIKDSVRNKIIRDYNANKIRALIVSSAGGEGLDLKGTRLVQLLEPHFNNEKLKQVIGRAARYKSHEDLSPEEKNVLVQQYLSTIKPTKMQEMFGEKNTSTDEYLKNLADEKEKLNNQFLEIIRSGQVD